MKQVRVEIDGHTYRMACGAGEEERVTALAEELDATIRQLKRRLGEIGDRRIAIMAAMTIFDKLKDAEERAADLKDRVAKLERAREEAALAAENEDEPLIERLDAATAAVERITRQLVDEAHALADEDPVPATFSHARGAAADEAESAPEAPPDDTAPDADDEPYPDFMQRS